MVDLTEKQISDLFSEDKRLINTLEEPCKSKFQEYLQKPSNSVFETSMGVYVRGEGFPETRTCYELAKRIAEVYSVLKSFELQAAYQREIGEKLPQYSWTQIHYALQRLHLTGIAFQNPNSYLCDLEKSYGFCYVFLEEDELREDLPPPTLNPLERHNDPRLDIFNIHMRTVKTGDRVQNKINTAKNL